VAELGSNGLTGLSLLLLLMSALLAAYRVLAGSGVVGRFLLLSQLLNF
jgi:hypothetical protein